MDGKYSYSISRSESTPIRRTIDLFHRRWSVPVIARLYAEGALTLGGLSTRLPAGRSTLAETLATLEQSGALVRGTGDRRMLYRLTEVGAALGAACVEMTRVIPNDEVLNVALKKWPMLVVTLIGRGSARFNELEAGLPGITSRALALSLKDLEAARMITRELKAGYPPTTIYALTPLMEAMFPALDALCAAAEATAAI